MADLLAVIAEVENAIMREVFWAGLARARQNGKRPGGPR
jgi:DNA invertase Pin-like site-specific DNA recombinase